MMPPQQQWPIVKEEYPLGTFYALGTGSRMWGSPKYSPKSFAMSRFLNFISVNILAS
jgi:hypothetical protein